MELVVALCLLFVVPRPIDLEMRIKFVTTIGTAATVPAIMLSGTHIERLGIRIYNL